MDLAEKFKNFHTKKEPVKITYILCPAQVSVLQRQERKELL